MQIHDRLQLLIKPVSADCNQSCRYCFYRRTSSLYPATTSHRMSGETLDCLIRRYLQLRLAQSVFCWQGGEPTLVGLDFYRQAVALMERHGRSGQSVSNAFQTNGLLLDSEWCRFFARYRFLVGLSLDGPPELHDAYRQISPDRGTHADVMRAVRFLREHAVEFNVLSVVTDLTARHAGQIYRYFRELGLGHMQFIPCLETDACGQPAPFSVSPEAYADFLIELFDLWLCEAKTGVSVRLFDSLLQREVTGESGMCDLDGTCASYLVVEHNGDSYPCDFFVQAEMRLGNIRTTPIESLVRRPPARKLRQARRHPPAKCAQCRWLPLCHGGCLKDRRRVGGLDLPTYFCRTWQRFFPHAEEPIRRLAMELQSATKMSRTPPSP